MKRYFNKSGTPVILRKAVKRKDGRIELNPSALSPSELAEQCGLFTYQPHAAKNSGKPTKQGKLIFDEITGTCFHEQIELSAEEVAAREEADLRAQFEAEQFEKEEQDREQKFKVWKADKKAKSK
jgi:hypothetical protein